jgi:hypothetical protein
MCHVADEHRLEPRVWPPPINLGPAAIRAASTGRTRNRTRSMLQQRHKVLAMAPSTRDLAGETGGAGLAGKIIQ